MPTIIDSLLVELNLKADGLRAGAEEAAESLANLEAASDNALDSASRLSRGVQNSQNELADNSRRTARGMQEHGAGASQFFSKIRNEAIMMLGVFTAGAGLAGFAKHTIDAAASTGLLSKQIGVNINQLNAMEAASQRAGGAEGAMTAQLKAEAEKRAKVLAGGNLTEIYGVKFLQGGGKADNMKDAESQIAEYAKMYERQKAAALKNGKSESESTAYAASFVKEAGAQEGILPLIMQGTAAMNDQVEAQKKKVFLTEKDAENARKSKQAWFDLTQQFDQFSQKVVVSLLPVMERLTVWLQKIKLPNPAEMSQTIDTWVGKLEPFFGTVEKGIGKVDKFAESVGGWTNILKALFALKMSSWIADLVLLTAKMVGFSTAASAAGTASTAMAGGLGAAGTALGVGAAAAGGAAVGSWAYNTGTAEQQQKWQDTLGRGVAKVAGWMGNKEAADAVATNDAYGDKPLGSLSSKYEGKVGSANKDNIGSAFGKYQFNDSTGGLAKFFEDNPQYADQFKGLQKGSPEFYAKWKEIARNDSGNFEAAQDRSAAKIWYNPAKEKAESVGFDMSNRGVQEAVFSGSIQHGGIKKLLARVGKKNDLKSMTPEQQIEAFYAERRKYVEENLSGSVLEAQEKRYDKEYKDAINMARTGQGKNPISYKDNSNMPPPVIIGKGQKDINGKVIQPGAGGFTPVLPQSAMVSAGLQGAASKTQNNNITINVKSTDPKLAANEIKTTLGEKLTSNFVSGMR